MSDHSTREIKRAGLRRGWWQHALPAPCVALSQSPVTLGVSQLQI